MQLDTVTFLQASPQLALLLAATQPNPAADHPAGAAHSPSSLGAVAAAAAAAVAASMVTAGVDQTGGMAQAVVYPTVYHEDQIVSCPRCATRFKSPQACHSLVCPECMLPVEENASAGTPTSAPVASQEVAEGPGQQPSLLAMVKEVHLTIEQEGITTIATQDSPCIHCGAGPGERHLIGDDPSPRGVADDKRRTRKRRRVSAPVQRKALRLGKYWRGYGYAGNAYCQRCSEVFRDHLIRENSNSAGCNRKLPCIDCAKILAQFTGEPAVIWARIEAKKATKCKAMADHLISTLATKPQGWKGKVGHLMDI